jgi:DNA-directed RNA polymerase specialized sigma24 family protein
MQSKRELTQTELFNLLNWLDPDTEKAGKRYELIRRGLIKMFTCRGCFEADELADETINRVAVRAESITGTYIGNPAAYFFGVAKKVYLEYQRKMPAHVPLDVHLLELPTPEPADEFKYECLESCMQQLPPTEREMVWHYYQAGTGAAERVALAQRLGLKLSTLRVKVFRLTSILEDCIHKCIQQGGTGKMK